MKKLFALILVLMTLTVCAASAEIGETVTFASSKSPYTMQIPADFTVVDQAFIDSIREIVESGAVNEQLGLTAEQGNMLLDSFAQTDFSTIDLISNPYWTGNVNIQHNEFGIPGSMLEAVKDMLDETLIQQFVGIGAQESEIMTFPVETIGNCIWYRISWSVSGITVLQYITTDSVGSGYLITFTGLEEDVINLMVSTFQF